jgi:hypothetical protein
MNIDLVLSFSCATIHFMQPTHAFEPGTVSLFGSIFAEIEAEFAAKGRVLNEVGREQIAQRIMAIAATGENDRNVIKRYARGEGLGDTSFLDTL